MSKQQINKRFIAIINFLIEQKHATTKLEIAEKLGISSSKFSEILGERMNVSAELIGNLAKNYPQISLEWIMLGEGNIFTQEQRSLPQLPSTAEINNKVVNSQHALPLLPMSAVAGWNGWDVAGVNFDECEKIYVPHFCELGAEFIIRITGNSMLPTLASGDMIACRKIRDTQYIQWGKIHLIDSEQGPMVKRIHPSDNHQTISCHSDNESYPPFNLPKSEIRSLSLVVGIIRME